MAPSVPVGVGHPEVMMSVSCCSSVVRYHLYKRGLRQRFSMIRKGQNVSFAERPAGTAGGLIGLCGFPRSHLFYFQGAVQAATSCHALFIPYGSIIIYHRTQCWYQDGDIRARTRADMKNLSGSGDA